MVWPDASVVTETAGERWGGLWSVVFTTERAVIALVQATSFAEGLDLIWFSEELREACEDLEAHHPADVASATAVDLGPVTAAQDIEAARAVLEGLLVAGLARADELAAEEWARDPSVSRDLLSLFGLTALLWCWDLRLGGKGSR